MTSQSKLKDSLTYVMDSYGLLKKKYSGKPSIL